MKTESIPSTLSKIYHLDFYILALGTGPDLKKLLPSKPYVHQAEECSLQAIRRRGKDSICGEDGL